MKLNREYESRSVDRDDIDVQLYDENEEFNIDDEVNGIEGDDIENDDPDDLDAELGQDGELDAELGQDGELDAELQEPPKEEPVDDTKATIISFLQTIASAINTTLDKIGAGEKAEDGALDIDLDKEQETDEQTFGSKEDLLRAVASNGEEEEERPTEGDGELDDELGDPDAGDFGEVDPNDENPNLDGDDPFDRKPEVDEFQIEDDQDRQGNVHYVKDAHLVYRRKQEDGTFEEMWIYNVGDEAARKPDDIIRDILAGTDIDDNQISSEDGAQEYTLWTVGNGQILKITGLPA